MYKIAEAASSVGVAPATLRLWEQHRLLAPERTKSGQRLYGTEDMDRARRVAELRIDRGMPIYEIRRVLGSPTTDMAVAPASGDEAGDTVGERLRHRRLGRRVSIRELAAAVGASTSVISTFERTSTGIGVGLLRRIADHLDVTVTALTLGDEASTPGSVRRGQGTRISSLGAGIETRTLATGPKLMDCKEWTIGPQANSGGSYRHKGEEFLYVLEGTIELSVEGMGTMTLSARDSLYFDSSREHSWRNPAQADCTVLWVNTPASF